VGAEGDHVVLVGTYLQQVMNDRTLVRLVLGVAAGVVLWDLLRGLSVLLIVVLSNADNAFRFEPLSWRVGGRTVSFYELAQGLIEAVLLLLIVWVLRRRSRSEPAVTASHAGLVEP
jgi:hypothetical protein